MPAFKLIVSYEGTLYYGLQSNGQLPTVEFFLKQAFEKIALPCMHLESASRTDRGVHALGQVVKVEFSSSPKDLRLTLVGLNSQLPEDIRILKLEACSESFHPTLDSTSKTYEYSISTGWAQAALYRRFRWHVPLMLDLQLMRQAAGHLLGTHEFQSFTNVKKQETYEDHTRTLYQLDILDLGSGEIKILVRGNHFLYKMVRNLVGLLVEVGKGKLKPDRVLNLLAFKDRREAPMTAPAHGLVLLAIDYEPISG